MYVAKEVKYSTLILKLFVLTLVLAGAGRIVAQENFKDAPTVNLCDLIQNPSDYDDQIVRVQATYRYYFEVQELFCSDCWEFGKGRVWVEFDDSWRKNTSWWIKRKFNYDDDAKTINVTFVGKFIDPNPGDPRTGPYQFKFILFRAEKAKVILDKAPAPPNLNTEVKKKTCCKKG